MYYIFAIVQFLYSLRMTSSHDSSYTDSFNTYAHSPRLLVTIENEMLKSISAARSKRLYFVICERKWVSLAGWLVGSGRSFYQLNPHNRLPPPQQWPERSSPADHLKHGGLRRRRDVFVAAAGIGHRLLVSSSFRGRWAEGEEEEEESFLSDQD